MIVYVVSNSKSFGGRLDVEPNMWLENNVPLYDGEHYLYRQEWRQDWQGQSHLNHMDFVKVVSDEWFSEHPYYYGSRVLDDIHQNDEPWTEYDRFDSEMRINN